MERWSNLSRLFEVDNARNLSRDEVVRTFVPTEAFWRLLSAKNHVVLGSRGSGKTQIAKMLSHSHLAKFENEHTRKLVEQRQFVGIYVSAKLSLSSPRVIADGTATSESLRNFTWSLNVATCSAFLETASSCINEYIADDEGRLRAEHQFTSKLADAWGQEFSESRSLKALNERLSDIAHDKQDEATRERVLGEPGKTAIGVYFYNDLYFPLRRAIDLFKRVLPFPAETRWLLCLDEVEWLSKKHHQLLNTPLRTDSGDLFFKITTMPYRHYTMETLTNVPLNERHDFEYVYLDRELWNFERSFRDRIPEFVRNLFKQRMKAAGYSSFKNLSQVLGRSRLIDEKAEDWSVNSDNFRYIEKYANKETIERARKLLEAHDEHRYYDQIVRKIRPAILLRRYREASRGRAEAPIYYGASLITRCSDNNPRTLIQIMRKLLSSVGDTSRSTTSTGYGVLKPISIENQHRIIQEYSSSFLRRVQAEENGHQIFELLEKLGNHMSRAIHEKKIGTDFVSSVDVNLQRDPALASLVRDAVGLGHLYPNVNPKDPDRLPYGEGTFQLAFILAPHFWVIPRKGDSRQLSFILSSHRNSEGAATSEDLFDR